MLNYIKEPSPLSIVKRNIFTHRLDHPKTAGLGHFIRRGRERTHRRASKRFLRISTKIAPRLRIHLPIFQGWSRFLSIFRLAHDRGDGSNATGRAKHEPAPRRLQQCACRLEPPASPRGRESVPSVALHYEWAPSTILNRRCFHGRETEVCRRGRPDRGW